MGESWYQRYTKEKGQVDAKENGTQLILRRGILLVRDSACIRIVNNTNKWWTYDRGTVVNENLPGGGFNKLNTFKVNPGKEDRLCAPYGVATQDHALYNLTSYDQDPIPNWSGGSFSIVSDLKAFIEGVSQTGRLVLGIVAVVGVIAVVGIVAGKLAKGYASVSTGGLIPAGNE